MITISHNSQNPYGSYLLQASAGSGKTYQLAKRYLYLVASGAHAPSILTITFTKKAASEMRERILGFAQDLLDSSEEEKASFQDTMLEFYENMPKHWHSSNPQFHSHKFRSAEDIARHLREHRNDLAIMTIDALFLQWLQRYPKGSSLSDFSEAARLIQEKELEEQQELAWQRLFHWPPLENHSLLSYHSSLARYDAVKSCIASLKALTGPSWDIAKLGSLVRNLDRYDLKLQVMQDAPYTYLERRLWQEIETYIGSEMWNSKISPHSPADLLGYWFENPSQVCEIQQILRSTFFSFAGPCLKKIVMYVSRYKRDFAKKKTDFEAAIDAQDEEFLQSSRWVTRNGTISGNKVSKKIREKDPQLNECIIAFEKHYHYYDDLKHLLQACLLFYGRYKLYLLWKEEFQALKEENCQLTFDDVTKGVMELFSESSEWGNDAFYLIQKSTQHLLMDELQDTNAVQWQIFSRIASELLACRDTALPRTVFMVGDEKQSLYGFREASPKVMKVAEEFFRKRSLPVLNLCKSYRSTPQLLDYVAEVFSSEPLLLSSFVPLKAANQDSTQSLSSISILSLVTKNMIPKEENLQEEEARILAEKISYILSHCREYPVCLKGVTRPIQPKDIVVLYRNATHASTFARIFAEYGLTAKLAQNMTLLSKAEVSDIFALMKYLLFPSDKLSLLQICRSPIVGVEEQDILAMIQHEFVQMYPLEAASNTVTQSNKYVCDVSEHVLDRLQWCVEEGSRAWEVFQILKDFFVSSSGKRWFVRFANLLESLSLEKRYISYYTLGGNDIAAHEVQENICTFRSLLYKAMENSEHQPYLALQSLARELENVDSQASSYDDCVTMMTIHKAKGLEYPMVCLTQSFSIFYQTKGEWDSMETFSGGDTLPGYCIMPRGLFPKSHTYDCLFDEYKAMLHKERYEEGKRLLYVALSRASQYLVVSASEISTTLGRTDKASEFLNKEIDAFYDVMKKGLEKFCMKRQKDILCKPLLVQRENQDAREYTEWSYESSELVHYKEAWKTKPPEACENMSGDSTTGDDFDIGLRQWWLDAHKAEFIPKGYSLQRGHQEGIFEQTSQNRFFASSSSISLDLKTVRGEYIHQLLEKALKDKRFSSLLPQSHYHLWGKYPQTQELAHLKDTAELEAKKSYDVLKRYLRDAKHVWSELALTALEAQEQHLVVGRVDLLVEFDNHWEVIDFKTQKLTEEDLDDSHQMYELRKRYESQLHIYQRCVQRMFPKAVVKALVFFTSVAKFVNMSESCKQP